MWCCLPIKHFLLEIETGLELRPRNYEIEGHPRSDTEC